MPRSPRTIAFVGDYLPPASSQSVVFAPYEYATTFEALRREQVLAVMEWLRPHGD